ncbi:S41 family peptidase [Streptomyces sp. NPDC006704]|uniref:S41 family peptidase n=1 Tax=Streptomyces sp. NPDC006704 TaxID=3364760 RepID=UPI0036CFD167
MSWGHRRRISVCAALASVVVAASGCTSGARPPDDGMTPAARTYLTKALDIMQDGSIFRHTVDWDTLRRKAFAQAHGARKPADTYGAIELAVASLGDHHSKFEDPEEAKQTISASAASFDGLEGRSLPHGIGYVSLPHVDGSQQLYDAYVRQGRAAVAKANGAGACGWVVDLRTETGGGMDPVLATLGPILGDGAVGAFVDADGKKSIWSIKGGAPYVDGKSLGWNTDVPPIGRSNPPIAVLTGPRTASAGEAVVVAFHGRPGTRFFGGGTSGHPTANESHPLSDGAELILTEAKEADRTGHIYDGPIAPDEEYPQDLNPAPGTDDTALAAAQKWLLGQAACR